MSAPIQGFAEHTIWHEIIMFQLCCEERSWPLILASLALASFYLSFLFFQGIGETTGKHSEPIFLPFISGLFNRQEAFIISIPQNNDFSYLDCRNLMTIIICCCSRQIKVGEKAASRHLLRTKNLKALMNLNE